LPTQRITVAKVGGAAADVTVRRLREWSAARLTTDPDEWSNEQWPEQVRHAADQFADRLRSNAVAPPVVYFVEWVDMWSMGDLFSHWLTPPDGPTPFVVHADRFELYAYSIPDAGRLARHLASAGAQQFEESDWFVARLREAGGAWQGLVERSVLVVLRQVVGALVSDEELLVSLDRTPDWLSDGSASAAEPARAPDRAGGK
jgi:hypothetical protein